MTTDPQLILNALEQAQRIVAEYYEPGASPCHPDVALARLLFVLDQQHLAAAQARLKAGYGCGWWNDPERATRQTFVGIGG